MIHEVAGIDFRPTDSVLEAVILESVYIKKFQPKYNVLGKDDKSWNYIVITKEEYPLVLILQNLQASMARCLLMLAEVMKSWPSWPLKNMQASMMQMNILMVAIFPGARTGQRHTTCIQPSKNFDI
jgi:hypothetical protein